MNTAIVNVAANDNKHGDCCGCPGIMADGHLFTQWQPQKQFNERLLKSVPGATNSEQLRYILQQKPELADIDKMTDERLSCRPNPKFYVDSSSFHKTMNDAQLNELKVPIAVGTFVHRELFPIDGSYKL